MAEPIISVIIPVYNAQEYLTECIGSVLNQSFENFEIICVDDGSNDGSGSILKKIAEKDGRVKMLTQINKGVGAARNAGLKQARGKYIYFLDSDDYIEKDTLQISYQELEEKSLDAVFFNTIAFGKEDFSEEFIETKNKYYARNNDYPAIYTGEELLCRLIKNHEYLCSISLQLVRRKLLADNGISFYEGIIHEDELYTIQTMMRAQRVLYLNRVLHHRRLRNDSIMTKPLDYHSPYSYALCIKEAYKYLLKTGCSQQKLRLILSHLKRLTVIARSQYSKLTEEEQKFCSDFSEEDRFLFELCIADGTETLKQRDRQLSDLKAKLSVIEQAKAEAIKAKETGARQLSDLKAKLSALEQAKTEAIKAKETGARQLSDLKAEVSALEQAKTEAIKEQENSRKRLKDMQKKVFQIEQLEAELVKQLNDKETALWQEKEKTKLLQAEMLKQLDDKETIIKQERESDRKREEETRQRIRQLEIENEKKERELIRISRHLTDVKTGWSFRTGRVITFIPRKIRDFLK